MSLSLGQYLRIKLLLYSVIPFGIVATTMNTAGEPPTNPLPATVFKNLQAGKKQTVIVYGTSLSDGAEWSKAMKRYFDRQYPGLVTFVNSAKSGEHSDWAVANLERRVLSNKPDLIIIEFSVNDAATKHHISTEKSAGNLDAMVSALRRQNPQVDIVLQTMNSAWDSPAQSQGKKFASERQHLADYYDVYRTYAHEHDLPLVDNYPIWLEMQQKDGDKFKKWLPDGLHPIPEASLAVTWLAIEALLDKTRLSAQ